MKCIPVVAALILLGAAGVVQADDRDCDSGDCGNPGFTGGVDITFFEFTARQGAGGESPGNIDDYFPDYSSTADARLWVGYQWKNHVGIRGRFFQWEESEAYNTFMADQNIEMYDLEATFDMSHGDWRILGSGGWRWGKIELVGADFGEINPMNFDGAGITLSASVEREVGAGVSLLGGMRYSILQGDTDFAPTSGAELDNTNVDVQELRFGVQWARKLSIGRLVVGAAWEQQTYGTDTYFPFAIDPETLGDVGLAGPVLSVAIVR